MDFSNINFKGIFRSYQKRILDNSKLYLADGKINIVAAPGSGKTILGLELIKRLNNPCIILSPSITIREQWKERFKSSFLPEGYNIDDYVSCNLNNIKLLNSITYQGLYSAINKISSVDEEEEIDYSNIDLFKLIKENNIRTICLDEAHHLQNEWQKALEKFIKGLDKDIKTISLTATPPYDAKTTEWQRYVQVCGEIDEEIFVPELVKQNTLCPHQDYIYFNFPTSTEINSFKEYRIKAIDAIDRIKEFDFIISICNVINNNYQNMLVDIYANVKEYIALLILFNHYEFNVDKKLIKLLTGVTYLPNINLHYAEVAIQFLIDSDLLNKVNKEVIVRLLKEYALYDRKQVYLDLNEKLKRKLISSVGKIDSIVQIVKSEYECLNDKLRMLILTDYIKKEELSKVGSNEIIDNVSVVSIFETLRRNYNIKIGVLSGGLVILHNDVLKSLDSNIFTSNIINNTNYSIINFKGSNKEKVYILSNLFEKGIINILIGTKSLLGEGWDSPCINSLILASFVGSFMLSNQMRGRAIRIDKNNPDKISNIWHLATIEPNYIFENNSFKKLESKVLNNHDIIESIDYDTLKRRFECFVGPSYDGYEIESGVERLTTIKPPYDKKGIDRINEKTIILSKNREEVRSKWRFSVEKSSKINIESQVPKERKIPAFTFINIGKILLIMSFESAMIVTLSQILTKVSTQTPLGFFSILAFIAFTFVCIYLISLATNKLIANANPTNQIKTFAKCILKTLKDFDIIETACHLNVKSDKNGIFINVAIDNATIHEQNIFNKAISEFLSPIDNPRYIIIKKGNLCKYNYKYSFACPTCIGKNKEMADVLRKYLDKYMGKYELVYTRYDNGRQFILECRKSSYITYNTKQINKKHKVSRWE